MTNAIELRRVTRRFGSVNALDTVDLAVPQDSIIGLLGRNGAGKTTAMSLIAGHDRPTSGEVLVNGVAAFETRSQLRDVCFVRDNQRYPDDYRLHHVLRIAPEFYPRWSVELAEEIVDALRIPTRTKISKMSRGQVSAVAIVLSLASRASVTLLDEPYLGLDVSARAMFHEILLRDYGEVPRTIVLSTHLIEESASLFDRVVIMEAGKIVLDADPDDAASRMLVVAGTTAAVEDAVRGARVLQRRTLVGLASATVDAASAPELVERAAASGLQCKPATLSELVAAYGARDAGSAAERDGSAGASASGERDGFDGVSTVGEGGTGDGAFHARGVIDAAGQGGRGSKADAADAGGSDGGRAGGNDDGGMAA